MAVRIESLQATLQSCSETEMPQKAQLVAPLTCQLDARVTMPLTPGSMAVSGSLQLGRAVMQCSPAQLPGLLMLMSAYTSCNLYRKLSAPRASTQFSAKVIHAMLMQMLAGAV